MNLQRYEETVAALERYLATVYPGRQDRTLVWSDGSITGPDPAMDQHGLEVVAEFLRSDGPFTSAEVRRRLARNRR